MKLSPELETLEKVFQKHGLFSLLVGGGARTYLATGSLAEDIDLEIRSKTNSTHDDYLSRLDKAFTEAAKTLALHLEPLAFSVMRLRGKNFEVECAPARRDQYNEDSKSFGHKDFIAYLLPTPTDEEAFLRRDFTVNALGVELTSGRIADPFQGQQDLAKKILRTKNPDFKKDPLRFLRAFRFATTLDLTMDQELESELKNMDLSRLEMDFYFREAFKKGGGGRFLQKTFEFLHKEKIEVHLSVDSWFFLKNLSKDSSLQTPEKFWGELALFHGKELAPFLETNGIKSLEKALGLKKKDLLALVKFSEYFLNWEMTDLEALKNLDFKKFQLDPRLRELDLLLQNCHRLNFEEMLSSNSQKLQLLQRLRDLSEFLKNFKMDYALFADDLKLRSARKLHTALQSLS